MKDRRLCIAITAFSGRSGRKLVTFIRYGDTTKNSICNLLSYIAVASALSPIDKLDASKLAFVPRNNFDYNFFQWPCTQLQWITIGYAIDVYVHLIVVTPDHRIVDSLSSRLTTQVTASPFPEYLSLRSKS